MSIEPIQDYAFTITPSPYKSITIGNIKYKPYKTLTNDQQNHIFNYFFTNSSTKALFDLDITYFSELTKDGRVHIHGSIFNVKKVGYIQMFEDEVLKWFGYPQKKKALGNEKEKIILTKVIYSSEGWNKYCLKQQTYEQKIKPGLRLSDFSLLEIEQ